MSGDPSEFGWLFNSEDSFAWLSQLLWLNSTGNAITVDSFSVKRIEKLALIAWTEIIAFILGNKPDLILHEITNQ